MTSIQDNEKIQNTSNHICLLTIERDTYRELCGELIQTLRHIQGAALDIDAGRATIALGAKKAITKAEAILGEKND